MLLAGSFLRSGKEKMQGFVPGKQSSRCRLLFAAIIIQEKQRKILFVQRILASSSDDEDRMMVLTRPELSHLVKLNPVSVELKFV